MKHARFSLLSAALATALAGCANPAPDNTGQPRQLVPGTITAPPGTFLIRNQVARVTDGPPGAVVIIDQRLSAEGLEKHPHPRSVPAFNWSKAGPNFLFLLNPYTFLFAPALIVYGGIAHHLEPAPPGAADCEPAAWRLTPEQGNRLSEAVAAVAPTAYLREQLQAQLETQAGGHASSPVPVRVLGLAEGDTAEGLAKRAAPQGSHTVLMIESLEIALRGYAQDGVCTAAVWTRMSLAWRRSGDGVAVYRAPLEIGWSGLAPEPAGTLEQAVADGALLQARLRQNLTALTESVGRLLEPDPPAGDGRQPADAPSRSNGNERVNCSVDGKRVWTNRSRCD